MGRTFKRKGSVMITAILTSNPERHSTLLLYFDVEVSKGIREDSMKIIDDLLSNHKYPATYAGRSILEQSLNGDLAMAIYEGDILPPLGSLPWRLKREAFAVELPDSKNIILSTARDLAGKFLYYDRKEDEDLPVGAIGVALERGEITEKEIVEAFEAALSEGLKG